MEYDVNVTSPSLDEAAGQPNATGAADSSTAGQVWPYKRWVDQAVPSNILLRPPAPPAAIDDPTLDAISSVREVMQQVLRAVRLIAAPWLTMPPDGESFHKAAGITIPAISAGTYTTVVSITCPPGRNGVLNRIANTFIGGGFNDFSGDIIWQIQRNPNSSTTAPERNFENITASLGNTNNPVAIAPIRIFENDVIVLAVTNVSIVVAAQIIGGLLGGWFYPRTWDDQFDSQDRNIAW